YELPKTRNFCRRRITSRLAPPLHRGPRRSALEVWMNQQDRRSGPASSPPTGCACGCGGSIAEHRAEVRRTPTDADYAGDQYVDRLVETAILRALFPNDLGRRAFLKAVGGATALAAIADVFPLATSKAIAQDTSGLEKTKLNIGYVPITCTVPILLAH